MWIAVSRSSMPTCTCKSEDQIGARHQLHVFDNIFIAVVGINFLHAPIGERMRGGGGEAQSVFARQADHVAAQFFQLVLGVFDVGADRGADLDHRLVHLGLHALLQHELALFDDLGVDVRAQIPRFRVDGLIFLFDTERESRSHRVIRARPAGKTRPADNPISIANMVERRGRDIGGGDFAPRISSASPRHPRKMLRIDGRAYA